MLYKIINPSDPYTIECPDLEIATIACTLLGGRQYAFEPIGNGIVVPPFLFGGINKFCERNFACGFDALRDRVLTERALDLATALDSCIIGDRSAYLEQLANLQPDSSPVAFANTWHDEHRSSLNDIGGRARTIANHLRSNAGLTHMPQPPQQVFVK